MVDELSPSQYFKTILCVLIYFVLLYPSFCGERFICLRCVIGTRTIQSWFYHCKIGSRSVHCGSGESSYMHAFSPFSSFGLFVLFFGWAMENGSFRFRIWSYVPGWTKYLLFFFYGQHAADEKFNFEHLARSTVMNQQPLLQWVALWSQFRWLIPFQCFHLHMLLRDSWISCCISAPTILVTHIYSLFSPKPGLWLWSSLQKKKLQY